VRQENIITNYLHVKFTITTIPVQTSLSIKRCHTRNATSTIYILRSVGEFVWPGAWLTWRQYGRGRGLGRTYGRADGPSHNRAKVNQNFNIITQLASK